MAANENGGKEDLKEEAVVRIKIRKNAAKKATLKQNAGKTKCDICTNYFENLVTPKTETGICTHSLCQYCWCKIVSCGNGLCPYCRDDVRLWAFYLYKVVKFIDSEERTCCDKVRYSHIFSNDTYLADLVVIDADSNKRQRYFFSPNNPKAIVSKDGKKFAVSDREEIDKVLLPNIERIRMVNESRYVINERFSNLSVEKYQLISGMKSVWIEDKVRCFCRKVFTETQYKKHLKIDENHRLIIKTLLDDRYDLFLQLFTGKNLDPD